MSDEAITIQFPEISEVAVLETVNRGGQNMDTVSVHFSVRPKSRQPEVDDRRVFSVTKETVGQVMSRDDPFYLPHRNNPFCGIFKDGRKLIGSHREHWGPLIDLHWPPGRDKEMALAALVQPRRCISLPNSPPRNRKEVDLRTMMNDSLPPVAMGRQDVSLVEDIDVQSEGASSNDSALGLEPIIKDPLYVRFSTKYFGLRKFSVDPGVISGPGERSYRANHTDRIVRQLEARVLDDALQRRFRTNPECATGGSDECGPCSFSSSESCMSLDENSIMSPTSSYSSYSENDSELWFNRAQLELYEHRLRSREWFQELVRRWEENQGRAAGNSQGSNTLSPAMASRPSQYTRTLLAPDRSVDINDPGMDRHFQELRHKWESKQLNSSQDSTRSPSNAARLTSQKAPSNEPEPVLLTLTEEKSPMQIPDV